jgi:undecaprenyl diphosphate synthase
MGHWEGAEVLIDVVRAGIELGCQTLTVYSFSTENWERPQEEIETLMNVFELYLTRKRDMMVKEGIRLSAIGDLSKLPPKVKEALDETKRQTQKGEKINLVLAINYGGRDEISRAVVKILQENQEKKIDIKKVTEDCISQKLDTQGGKDPDLLIRTSGELRLSNFLLWQIAYAEFYFSETLWPDFKADDLYQAIISYQQRERREPGDGARRASHEGAGQGRGCRSGGRRPTGFALGSTTAARRGRGRAAEAAGPARHLVRR